MTKEELIKLISTEDGFEKYANQLRAEGVEMLRDEFKKHDEQFKVRCDWFISQLLRAPTDANLRKENCNG